MGALFQIKGENSQPANTQWLVNEILLFQSAGLRLLMAGDSEHKVEALDNGWVLDSE